MSYGIGLHFKHVKDEKEVLDLMYNIQQEYTSKINVIEFLEANKYWLVENYAYYRDHKLVDGVFSKSQLFNYFVQNIFTFRFYYWKQYNLIAYCHMANPLPLHLKKYFDGYIYFQDSCDQNYDYSEWEVLGDLAKPFIEKVKTMTMQEIYSELFDWEPDSKEDLIRMKDYNEKALVYKWVEDALDIHSAVWLNKTNAFKYFEITKSFNDDHYKTLRQVIEFLEKSYKEEYDNDRE